jgi:xylulokinase
MDTDAAMLLAGARVGQLLNVSGSTDVLAVCTDRPKPHERLLTRAFGIGRRWLSVSTLAAAGSALDWARRELFPDLSQAAFQKLLRELANEPESSSAGVRFEPYLAGERTSVEQRTGSFTGLTLATTRRQMLSAVIESLAQASAARLPLLRETGVTLRREVLVSGGVQQSLADILHRDWRGKWRFRAEPDATLRGLARLAKADGTESHQ